VHPTLVTTSTTRAHFTLDRMVPDMSLARLLHSPQLCRYVYTCAERTIPCTRTWVTAGQYCGPFGGGQTRGRGFAPGSRRVEGEPRSATWPIPRPQLAPGAQLPGSGRGAAGQTLGTQMVPEPWQRFATPRAKHNVPLCMTKRRPWSGHAPRRARRHRAAHTAPA